MDEIKELFNSINNRLLSLDRRLERLEKYPNAIVAATESVVTNTNNISEAQDALCETSIDVDERITTIEDALCELSKEE